jgi:hypothetical protein
VLVHDEHLGDAPAGRIDAAAQELRRRALQDGIDRGRRDVPISARQARSSASMRAWSIAGILGVLALNGPTISADCDHAMISASRNACMAAAEFIGGGGRGGHGGQDCDSGQAHRINLSACDNGCRARWRASWTVAANPEGW